MPGHVIPCDQGRDIAFGMDFVPDGIFEGMLQPSTTVDIVAEIINGKRLLCWFILEGDPSWTGVGQARRDVVSTVKRTDS